MYNYAGYNELGYLILIREDEYPIIADTGSGLKQRKKSVIKSKEYNIDSLVFKSVDNENDLIAITFDNIDYNIEISSITSYNYFINDNIVAICNTNNLDDYQVNAIVNFTYDIEKNLKADNYYFYKTNELDISSVALSYYYNNFDIYSINFNNSEESLTPIDSVLFSKSDKDIFMKATTNYEQLLMLLTMKV